MTCGELIEILKTFPVEAKMNHTDVDQWGYAVVEELRPEDVVIDKKGEIFL